MARARIPAPGRLALPALPGPALRALADLERRDDQPSRPARAARINPAPPRSQRSPRHPRRADRRGRRLVAQDRRGTGGEGVGPRVGPVRAGEEAAEQAPAPGRPRLRALGAGPGGLLEPPGLGDPREELLRAVLARRREDLLG